MLNECSRSVKKKCSNGSCSGFLNSWNVENTGAWKTEDTDNFFYEIEEKK